MTRREMLTKFSKMKVPPGLFYFGPIEKAEMVNGLSWNGTEWVVYYREHGTLFDVSSFKTEEAAIDEYCARILVLNEQIQQNKEG